MSQNDQLDLDSGLLVFGFTFGLLAGGLVALFRAPGRGLRQQITGAGENIRGKLESIVPADPIAESLAEGKAAARRRQIELGLIDENAR